MHLTVPSLDCITGVKAPNQKAGPFQLSHKAVIMNYQFIIWQISSCLNSWKKENISNLIYPNKSMTAQVAKQNNVFLLVGSDACNRIAPPFYTRRNTFKNVYTFFYRKAFSKCKRSILTTSISVALAKSYFLVQGIDSLVYKWNLLTHSLVWHVACHIYTSMG